jgi:hypothetical protein
LFHKLADGQGFDTEPTSVSLRPMS